MVERKPQIWKQSSLAPNETRQTNKGRKKFKVLFKVHLQLNAQKKNKSKNEIFNEINLPKKIA